MKPQEIIIGRTYANKKGTSYRTVYGIGVQYRQTGIEGPLPSNYRDPTAPGVWSNSGRTMLSTFAKWAAREVIAMRPRERK